MTYATELKKDIEDIQSNSSAINEFLEWLSSSQDFAIVDISENSDKPMEPVSEDLVLDAYRKYLTGLLADVESEIED